MQIRRSKDFNIKMEPILTCRFFDNFFGPNSDPVPVYSDQQTLTFLDQALGAGLSVSNTSSSTGASEASHAMDTAVGWLRKNGRAPFNLDGLKGLSDDQRKALDFDPLMGPSDSVQDMGVPPFKELNMARFFAGLRFVARYQELLTGSKPVFQVGIVTLTVQGTSQQYFAQTLATELGEVTDTVWLYRWCVTGVDGQYEEHWRAFDGPTVLQPTTAGTGAQDQGAPRTAVANDNNPYAVDQTLPLQGTQEPVARRGKRHAYWHDFKHAHLSDEQLFKVRQQLLQGDAILRLARSYSNQQIFNRINASRAESEQVKSVSVITKRLTHAVQAASQASGRSVGEIRAELAGAKNSKGVKHKSKLGTTPNV